MLRFLRSQYGLIYKLSISKAFTKIELKERFNITCDNQSAITILRRSIQGLILELIALELSSLIKIGHIEQPKMFIIALLSSTGEVIPKMPASSENGYDDESYYEVTDTVTNNVQPSGKGAIY